MSQEMRSQPSLAAEVARRASARIGALELENIQAGAMLDEAGQAVDRYRARAEEAERQLARLAGDLEGLKAAIREKLPPLVAVVRARQKEPGVNVSVVAAERSLHDIGEMVAATPPSKDQEGPDGATAPSS